MDADISLTMGLRDYEAQNPLDEFKLSIKSLSKKTEAFYLMALDEFCKFHDTTPSKLYDWVVENQASKQSSKSLAIRHAFEDFRKYLIEEKGLSPNTAQNYRKALNKFLKANGLNQLPSERGKTVGAKAVKSITKEQIREMISYTGTDMRVRALIYTVKDAGLRVSDLEQLTVEYYQGMRRMFDTQGREFRFWKEPLITRKAGVNAYVCLGPEAITAIDNYIVNRESGAIFRTISNSSESSMVITKGPRKGQRINRKGSTADQPMRKTNITNVFLSYSKPLRDRGIRITAHSFRKFFLNAWTVQGFKDHGKLFVGKSLGKNDGAYIDTENGDLEKLYMENYNSVLGLEDTSTVDTVRKLEHKLRNQEKQLDEMQNNLNNSLLSTAQTLNLALKHMNKQQALETLTLLQNRQLIIKKSPEQILKELDETMKQKLTEQ
jgi:integrase